MNGNSLTYTVKPGETVWSIAEKFQINPREMITANELMGLGAVFSGQSLLIPDYCGRYRRELLGYYLGGQNPIKFDEIKSPLTSLSPCWVELNESGTLNVRIDSAILEEARNKRIKVYVHIQSFGYDGKIADRIIEKTSLRHRVLRHVCDLLEEYHFTGVNLHLKNISAHNRDYLSKLVQELALTLHQDGLSTMVTLPAKTGNTCDSHWASAYDYHTIGQYADQIVIEAYDFHWAEGHPGPIAPVFWVKDVLDYALMEIAEDKIILGVPCYGYDWIITNRGRAQLLSFQRVVELKERNNSEILWDQDAQSPYLYYFAGGEEHQIWFENCESLLTKIDLVKKYHLGGMAFWSLGYEDPKIWPILQKLSHN